MLSNLIVRAICCFSIFKIPPSIATKSTHEERRNNDTNDSKEDDYDSDIDNTIDSEIEIEIDIDADKHQQTWTKSSHVESQTELSALHIPRIATKFLVTTEHTTI